MGDDQDAAVFAAQSVDAVGDYAQGQVGDGSANSVLGASSDSDVKSISQSAHFNTSNCSPVTGSEIPLK